MVTESTIELVQERSHKYALSLNDDIVSTITNGASIVIKFKRETEPLHFSCLAQAIHLSVWDLLYIEKPKQISYECRDGGGICNATANNESQGKEYAEEKSDEQECDEEQQNCFDIIPEIKEVIKKVRKIIKIFRKFPVKNNDNLQPQAPPRFTDMFSKSLSPKRSGDEAAIKQNKRYFLFGENWRRLHGGNHKSLSVLSENKT